MLHGDLIFVYENQSGIIIKFGPTCLI